MVDYTPLWKTIHEREITQYAMLQDKVLDNHTLDRLKRTFLNGLPQRLDDLLFLLINVPVYSLHFFLGCSRFLPASVHDHFSGSSVGSGSLRLLFL